MKNNIRKGPILYGGMVRGRRKFLIINLIITLLYIFYMFRAMPYIVAKFHGPYDFDAEKFVSATEKITITEVIEMKKRADKTIPGSAFMETSYHDGDMYRFSVKFDSIEEIGVQYTRDIEDPKTGDIVTYVVHSVCMGRIGDTLVPVLFMGDDIPSPETSVAGIFVEPAEVIKADISKLTADGTPITISEYIFDARNVEMELENTDVTMMFVGIILLVFLYLRLSKYYLNPYSHPTYKQLLKYGNLEDVVNDIENQFEADTVYTEDKELISTDWIMTKEPFKNKIVKNHRTRGRYS